MSSTFVYTVVFRLRTCWPLNGFLDHIGAWLLRAAIRAGTDFRGGLPHRWLLELTAAYETIYNRPAARILHDGCHRITRVGIVIISTPASPRLRRRRVSPAHNRRHDHGIAHSIIGLKSSARMGPTSQQRREHLPARQPNYSELPASPCSA